MVQENLLRVTCIEVGNLFDRYSHKVSLRLDDRVTIIHGPNGVGKTVLLRLTAALLSGRFAEFLKVPFETFEVSLSDGSVLGAKRAQIPSREQDAGSVVFFIKGPHRQYEEFLSQDAGEAQSLAGRIESEVPWLAQYGPSTFHDRRTGEVLTSFDVVARYSEHLPDRLRRRAISPIPEWMKELQRRVGVHLIEAQRLFRFASPMEWDSRYYPHDVRTQYIETVKDYSKDLHRRMSETLAEYAKVSQSLDQSFPERLLRGRNIAGLSIETLKSRMQSLEFKRQQLKRIGLIEEDAAYPFDITALENSDEAQRSVLTLYVGDTETKLGVLDDLARRMELFCNNINQKFQHKTLEIKRDTGFNAITADGKTLELASLSSGEQHELVLLYDLLFRVKPNTLVLLDEPELSLHVTWQKSFLPDLLQIVSATRFDVVLATHSPFIVGDRSDLMTPLLAEANGKRS